MSIVKEIMKTFYLYFVLMYSTYGIAYWIFIEQFALKQTITFLDHLSKGQSSGRPIDGNKQFNFRKNRARNWQTFVSNITDVFHWSDENRFARKLSLNFIVRNILWSN